MEQALSVGFIGLGLMGRPMARNLLAAGHRLSFVVHRDRGAVSELEQAGGVLVGSPAELAARSRVVILCVPGGEVVERVTFGEQGLVRGAGELLVIDCSTSQPQASIGWSRRLASGGIRFVDAPVVRGPREAASRRLVALAGGATEDVERARTVLSAFCENVIHLGAVGAGQQAKLINNFLALGSLALLAEAHASALRLGVDVPRLCEAVSLGGGNSRLFQAMVPWMTERDERRAQAAIGTALKDVSYYAGMAREAGAPDALAREVQALFERAVQAGYGDRFLPHLLDFAATRHD